MTSVRLEPAVPRSRVKHSSHCTPPDPIFGPIQDFIAVLATCRNEDDSIKNEGARVLTTLYIDFSDAQGQLTRLSPTPMMLLMKFDINRPAGQRYLFESVAARTDGRTHGRRLKSHPITY